jgi:Uma2 family endonuclease
MSAETRLIGEQRRPPPGELTYEEFLAWCDEDTWAEWVDGRVIPLPVTVAERHAAILSLLITLFKLATRFGRLGAVYSEPFQMRLRAARRGRSPDLIFVAPEHRDRLRRHYLDGPADIVVEIVSPESAHRDQVEKLAEYEQAGVPEYWLVDPDQQQAELRVLGPDGRHRVVFTGSEGLYQSAVLPQLRLRVEWLWQEPELDEVLRKLGADPS